MKVPAECEALKRELKIGVTTDILERLERTLTKNCERAWCASFAWSVLVLVHAHEKLGVHAELLGRAAWLCCAPIQSHEFELTLRPFDFDKLLSNLVYRFLEHIESYTWATMLCSLLYERARCHLKDRNKLTESFQDLCIGRDFLDRPPLFGTRDDGVLARLCLNCQLFWLRLKSGCKAISIPAIRTLLFHDQGIIATLGSVEGGSGKLFCEHWKQAMRILLSQHLDGQLAQLVEVDCQVWNSLSNLAEAVVDLSKLKHLVFLLHDGSIQALAPLWTFELAQNQTAEAALQLLGKLPLERLQSLLSWPTIAPSDKAFLLVLCSTLRHTFSSQGHKGERIRCSQSAEKWSTFTIGRTISQGNPSEQQLEIFLGFLNGIETVRLPQTMQVLDGCIRLASQLPSFDEKGILIALRRLCKLGAHFDNLQAALQTLYSVSRLFGHQEKNQLALSTLELAERHVSETGDGTELLAKLWAQLLTKCSEDCRVLPKTTGLCARVIRLLPRVCESPSSLLEWAFRTCLDNVQTAATCIHSMLQAGSAKQPDVVDKWVRLAAELSLRYPKNTLPSCTQLMWSYMAKLDVSNIVEQLRVTPPSPNPGLIVEHAAVLLKLLGYPDLVDLLLVVEEEEKRAGERDDVNTPRLTLLKEQIDAVLIDTVDGYTAKDVEGLDSIYRSKMFYLQGKSTLSYRLAKEHFETILENLKSARHTTSELWREHCALLCSLEWLVFMCDSFGCYTLTRYYLKGALQYSTSFRACGRIGRLKMWLERVESGSNLPRHDCDPFTVARLDLVPSWIDAHIATLGGERLADGPLSIKVFPPTLAKAVPMEAELMKVLTLAWRCGNSHQVRALISELLYRQSDPMTMVGLVKLVGDCEFGDVLTTERPKEFNEALAEAQRLMRDSSKLKGPTVQIFIDPKRNLAYFSCLPSALYCGQVVVLRISPEFSVGTCHEELLRVIKENEEMLFHPSAVPQDDLSKRSWWQRRHELEKRLGVIIDQLDSLLRVARAFMPANLHRKVEKLPSSWKSLTIPKGIDPAILYSAMADDEALSGALLGALGFTDKDVRVMLTLRPHKALEEFNPFVTPQQASDVLLMIVPDSYSHDFPWESCPSLADFKVLRSFVGCAGENQLSFQSITAILNPGGDLKRTEETLSPLITELATRLIAGRPPTAEEMRSAFSDSDLAMYFGHGSGESYLSRQEIGKLNPCAASFLFGCSSGRLKAKGTWNSEGALIAFRQARCPLVLCNLWDVTDRDIDKLTISFLTSLKLKTKRSTNISDCIRSLQSSRSLCLLKLLNGAAPVIYSQ